MAMKHWQKQRWRWLPVLMLLAAFALRLHHIEAFGFWTDESLTPLRASYPLSQILQNEIIIQDVVTKDTHPPFYYLIIHFTRQVLGETDFAYRYPSLLAGLLLLPLLFQLGRRLYNRYLGLVVAGLAAVNPLYIWYAHEARMYTLFVLLMAGAAYALWRALAGADLRRWLLIYLLLAGLGLYTHYTAVFLIAAQAPFWLWLLWQNGQKKLIIAGAVVAVLSAVPLIPFTVPRLFTGAEANYHYVSPLIMLQDVVHFFGLGLTVNFDQMGIRLLDLLALGLLLLGVYAAGNWPRRAFLLTYLLAVVLGLMAGSLLKPMYQGVRHIMVGSPAFLLLLGWAVVYAGEQVWLRYTPAHSRQKRFGWAIIFAAGLLTLTIGPAVSLHNLYNRPDLYAKDDFRHLIAQMERMAGENDVIVYNNAIHLPLHDHYRTRPDVAVAAVPVYPTLAEQTAVSDLTQLSQTYDRIWFVTDPPADDRDEDKLARQWLETNLLPLTRLEAHARTTVVESLAFATTLPTATNEVLNDALDLTWPDLPPLRGFQLENDQPVTSPTLWFYLYWHALPAPPESAVLRVSLHDERGWEWAAHIHPIHPSARGWPDAEMVRQPYWLTLPRALPPGPYALRLQPLAAGQPLAEAQTVTTVAVAASPLPDRFWFEPQPIRFDNGLQLSGWQLADTAVYPGHNLPLTLYWQTDAPLPLDDVRYELILYQADGTPLRQQSGRPGAAWLPALPANALVSEQTGIYIRPETPPGRYRLQWRLWVGDDVVGVRPLWRPWSTESVILGEVEVAAWPLETNLPDDMTPVGAAFGPVIDLYGYRLAADADQLQLDLTWRADGQPETDLMLFVHLLSPQNEVVAQVDRVPGNGLRPLSGWRPEEVITDEIRLNLPTDLPPDEYRIMVGFYHAEEGYRLPVVLDGVAQPNDQLLLTRVTLP
jgi:hypothetical protein